MKTFLDSFSHLPNSFSAQIKTPIRFRVFKFNWGRGRLRKYQSLTSFAAGFCALNQLTTKQFRSFWSEAFRCFQSKDEEYVNRIAHLLDEPLLVVRTVFGRTPWCDWVLYRQDSEDNRRIDTISYCSICLADGFHGYFHEDSWLKKCPIHNTDLTREALPYSANDTKFDRYVHRLMELLDCASPGWPVAEMTDGGWRNEDNISVLVEFLRWQRTAKMSMVKWSDICVSLSDQDKYRFRHLDLLLGRSAWITPLPDRFAEFLVVKPWPTEPEVQCYGRDVADELSRLLAITSLPRLLWIYRIANLVRGDMRSYRHVADVAIGNFASHHGSNDCKCTWGKSKYDGWGRFESGTLSDYGSFMCPYLLAAEELRCYWSEMFPESHWQYHHIWTYRDAVRQYEEQGLVEVVGTGDRSTSVLGGEYLKQMPILEFRWPLQVTYLFDTILQKLVKAQVEELTHGLEAVAAGIHPSRRDHFPPSVYLVRKESGELLLVVWPAGRGRPFEDTVSKSWRMGYRRATSGE